MYSIKALRLLWSPPLYQTLLTCSTLLYVSLGYSRHNVSLNDALECDFYVKKGMRGYDLRGMKESSRFPHLIFWEYPLIWRDDPVVPERVWSFINWDHLNG